MISLPALVLEAKSGETGQQHILGVIDSASNSWRVSQSQAALISSNYAGKTCAMSAPPQLRQAAGDERIWGNLGSLESRNENLGTVIRGVRQIRHSTFGAPTWNTWVDPVWFKRYATYMP